MEQPCYINLEQARGVLVEMGVELSSRQMKRAARMHVDALVSEILSQELRELRIFRHFPSRTARELCHVLFEGLRREANPLSLR